MPAHSLLVCDHRPKGGDFGASGTGSSNDAKDYRAGIMKLMAEGRFFEAMKMDMNDLLNTHMLSNGLVNHGYHVEGLVQAVEYAHSRGLLKDKEMEDLILWLRSYLPADEQQKLFDKMEVDDDASKEKNENPK